MAVGGGDSGGDGGRGERKVWRDLCMGFSLKKSKYVIDCCQ